MTSVEWTPRAARQLRRIDLQRQGQIVAAVRSLVHMPQVINVKALVQHRCEYRLRVGNYRVLFDWKRELQIIEIQEVERRDEQTY